MINLGGGYVCFNSVYLVSFNVHKYTWTGNFFTVKLTSKHNNEYNQEKTSETGRSDMGQNRTIKLFRAIYKSFHQNVCQGWDRIKFWYKVDYFSLSGLFLHLVSG